MKKIISEFKKRVDYIYLERLKCPKDCSGRQSLLEKINKLEKSYDQNTK